jgi:molybdate transport system substrate-binding protein
MRRFLALAFALAVAAALAPPSGAAALTVYAAASLRDAFPRIDGRPAFNFAGSDALELQIERGAPADVFASAAPDQARALFRAARCTRPVTFATNVLVLLVPRDNRARLRSVYSLRKGGLRLAIGARGVPVGDYTRSLLRRMRLSGVLGANTVSEEQSVSSVVAKVGLGSADAGFAYVTDARAARGRVRAIALPRWAQPPVRYQICAVLRPGADARGARAFIDRVLSPRGRRLLDADGFGLPPRG